MYTVDIVKQKLNSSLERISKCVTFWLRSQGCRYYGAAGGPRTKPGFRASAFKRPQFDHKLYSLLVTAARLLLCIYCVRGWHWWSELNRVALLLKRWDASAGWLEHGVSKTSSIDDPHENLHVHNRKILVKGRFVVIRRDYGFWQNGPAGQRMQKVEDHRSHQGPKLFACSRASVVTWVLRPSVISRDNQQHGRCTPYS
jgi:hypothetical protein